MRLDPVGVWIRTIVEGRENPVLDKTEWVGRGGRKERRWEEGEVGTRRSKADWSGRRLRRRLEGT